MAGDAELWLGGVSLRLAAGRSFIVPAFGKHGFRNIGATELHMHAILASSEFEATLDGTGETIRRWGNIDHG